MIGDPAVNLLVGELVEHRDMVVECDDGEDAQKNNLQRFFPHAFTILMLKLYFANGFVYVSCGWRPRVIS
jgi:hypothetical protein